MLLLRMYTIRLILILVYITSTVITAQITDKDSLSISVLKTQSLEELMDIDLSIISKKPESWVETPASVYVITGDEILRSGAVNLPEALRLSPKLRVAKINSHGWIITARGFSNIFANKLLVMIDGRSVYTPLFAGVLWDVQSVFLEDLERVEITTGPGGTLWGSNAVNGVINVITKDAKQTEGLYASAAGGTFLQDWVSLRYGSSIGEDISFRVYAQHYDHNNTFLSNGGDNADQWGITHSGFRLDWVPRENNSLTLQGDLYSGIQNSFPSDSKYNGQYILARWNYDFSSSSGITTHIYADRTWRKDIPSTLTDELLTYDFDFQHHFRLSRSHNIVWGIGYRVMENKILNSTQSLGFLPQKRDMHLYSGFLQDEITLSDRIKFTLGSKVEHNIFTGYEFQPGIRILFIPGDLNAIWASLTRAVRSPSRIDVDYHIPAYSLPPDLPSVAGGPEFKSESLLAYELGYRIMPLNELSVDFSLFYNSYFDLYSVEPLPGTMTYQIQNGSEGESWGAELSLSCQLFDWWWLRTGYNYFSIKLGNKPGHSFNTSILANDPENQFMLHSMINLIPKVHVDILLRYTSSLPEPHTPAFFLLDSRVAWVLENWEISVVGQNLINNRHVEYGNLEIPRGVFGKISFSL
ncbi:MAG: TonB-dependent receptor [Ignavibacteriaceae bacterium]